MRVLAQGPVLTHSCRGHLLGATASPMAQGAGAPSLKEELNSQRKPSWALTANIKLIDGSRDVCVPWEHLVPLRSGEFARRLHRKLPFLCQDL